MVILLESKRDDMLFPYVNLLRERGINTNVSQLKQVLLKKFVNEGLMRNLSLSSNFYLVGVARYYFNGDLTVNKKLNIFDETVTDEFIPEICERLNACIMILRNAYIDSVGTKFEQPEDFGTLKLAALLRKYNKKINIELGIVDTKKPKKDEPEKTPINVNVGNGYTFDIIYQWEDVKKYNKFTEPDAWCITYGQNHYNRYIKMLGIHYVILRQNNYESVPRRMGKNFTKKKPHDEYGNSLIALLLSNVNGEPVYITSRWNHGSYRDGSQGTEADHAYTKEELFHYTGLTDADLQYIHKIWNENKQIKKRDNSKNAEEARKTKLMTLRYLKYGQMRLNGGEDIDTVFDDPDKHVLCGSENDFKKSISALKIRVDINGDNYVTAQILYVKGKLLFETFRVVPRNSWANLNNTFIMLNNKKDIIHINYDKQNMFFDVKRKQLISIDGVYKFKYIPYSWNRVSDDDSFYEVAMSGNQHALIDLRTCKPLRLPNGDFWFEWVKGSTYRHNGSDVRCEIFDKKVTCLEITYDSAAQELFFYETNLKRFFKPVVTEDDARVHLYSSSKDLHVFRSGFNNGVSRFSVYRGCDKLAISNIDEFRDISLDCAAFNIMLCRKRDVNEESILYDLTNGENIILKDYEGGFVSPYNIRVFKNENNKRIIALNTNSLSSNNYSIYNLDERKFYLNPITNDYIFHFYSDCRTTDDNKITILKVPYCWLISNEIPERNNTLTIDFNEVISATNRHYNTVGGYPKSDSEALRRYFHNTNAPMSPLVRDLLAIENFNWTAYQEIKAKYEN